MQGKKEIFFKLPKDIAQLSRIFNEKRKKTEMKWDIAADPAAIKSTLKVIESTMNNFILINLTIWKKQTSSSKTTNYLKSANMK